MLSGNCFTLSSISPGFGQGSGLKPVGEAVGEGYAEASISPGFGQGSGLKPLSERISQIESNISPGFGQGSGLKRHGRPYLEGGPLSPLASVRGAD